jgi:phospholipid/cholesterol/gamma-HCH transport system ATP-binding protein
MRGVKMTFGGVTLLNDISFEVEAGERVSLVGPGGSGKSTILKILLGLLKPDEGEVRLFDTDMVGSDERARQAVLRRVGMAFQQGALFDFMTVRENLVFAMENMTEMDFAAMDKRLKELLNGVKLGRTENMFPFELSGGMQRRVGIARALCTNPTIAIFDEPTSGLDPVTSTIILNMIFALGGASAETAQIVVTSNVEIGIRFADRILVVNDGRIVADGPWRELLMTGPEWVRHFLGVRFIGLDREYADELKLPPKFIEQHW